MDHIWKIYDLESIIADGMVTSVTYACESNLDGIGTREIGDISLTTGSASDSDFIPYTDLTEAGVLGWITGSIDTTAIETSNSASIARDKTALDAVTTKTGTPW